MTASTKVFQAIQVLLHKQYFEKSYSNCEVRFIDFCIENDDEELRNYEKELESYLLYIAIYDGEFEKIYSTWDRISFSDIKKIMKNPDFKNLYNESKVSEWE